MKLEILLIYVLLLCYNRTVLAVTYHYNTKGLLVKTPNYFPHIRDPSLNIHLSNYFELFSEKDKQVLWTRIFSAQFPITSRVLIIILLDIQNYLRNIGHYVDLNFMFINLQDYLIASKNSEDDESYETFNSDSSSNTLYVDPKQIFQIPRE